MISRSDEANLSICKDKSQRRDPTLSNYLTYQDDAFSINAKWPCSLSLLTVCLCWSDIWRNVSWDAFIIVSRLFISAWCWIFVSKKVQVLIIMMNHIHTAFTQRPFTLFKYFIYENVLCIRNFSFFFYQTVSVLSDVFGIAERSTTPYNVAPPASNGCWEIGKR